MRAHLEDNAGDALRADLLATVGGSVVVMCELFQATEARGAGQRVAELRRRERGLCDEPGLFLPIPGGWQMILLEVGLELPVLENVIHELWQLFGRRFERVLGKSKSQDGSNLRPKMAPSWTQNS